MKILLTIIFSPKKANPLLAYPHRGGGGGLIPLRAPKISKKAGRHPPPLGEGVQATKKKAWHAINIANSLKSRKI